MSAHDTQAIIQVLNLYGLAIDSCRWDLFDRVFTADVDARYPDGGHWHDLARFKADFAAAHAPLRHTQHAMSNHVVTVAGDAAQAFSYVSWRLVQDDPAGGADLREGTAWYDDDLVRTDRGWLIRRRDCRIAWWQHRRLAVDDLARMGAELPLRQVRDEAARGNVAVLSMLGT